MKKVVIVVESIHGPWYQPTKYIKVIHDDGFYTVYNTHNNKLVLHAKVED